jgi:hydroxyacylglutathione hydrolase
MSVEIVGREIGPIATNVYLLADARTREAIAIDTATPCLGWLSGVLVERGWRLRLIVSTHGHWDHIGDNAAVQAWSREQYAHRAEHGFAVESTEGAASDDRAAETHPDRAAGADSDETDPADGPPAEAPIAVHPLDRERLIHPKPLFAPFDIPPSVPAVDLAEGGRVHFGEIELEVIHTPGHTEGSVCLLERAAGVLLSGDTLFSGSWGRTDLPGGSDEQMAASLARLGGLDDRLRVLPGHGETTTIGRERVWLDRVKVSGRLPY